jgi:hypothetical protein
VGACEKYRFQGTSPDLQAPLHPLEFPSRLRSPGQFCSSGIYTSAIKSTHFSAFTEPHNHSHNLTVNISLIPKGPWYPVTLHSHLSPNLPLIYFLPS